MRYSSFNWAARGKRGWIFGPFFGRTLTVTLERKCFATGGLIITPDTTLPAVRPDGYVLSARVLRELGADSGLLAKLNRSDGHQA